MENSWKKLMDGNGDELFFVEFHNLNFIHKIWLMLMRSRQIYCKSLIWAHKQKVLNFI